MSRLNVDMFHTSFNQVIVCDKLMLPYEELLDYSSFVIFVSEQELLQKPDFNLFELLEQIPKKEVRRLQANGRAVKRHFTFHPGDIVPGDAFDMFVSLMWQIVICPSLSRGYATNSRP